MDERFQCWAFPFRVQMYKCKVHFNYCKEITSESFSQVFCNYWRLLLAEGSQDKGSFEPVIHSTHDLKTSPYTIYMSTYAFPCDFSVSLVYDYVYVWWDQECFDVFFLFGLWVSVNTGYCHSPSTSHIHSKQSHCSHKQIKSLPICRGAFSSWVKRVWH